MNEKLIEYDKRIGVPSFEGWQQREIESQQNYCKCDKQDKGLTLGNSPYCRTCNNWIEQQNAN